MIDRARTAHHEAGHAVARIAFGLPLGLASIRPTDHYAGVCTTEYDPALGDVRPDRPPNRQPPGVRDDLEARLIVWMAGPMAGDAFGWPGGTSRQTPEPTPEEVERVVSSLPPRHRELLHRTEADDSEQESDEERTWSVSHAFVGDPAGATYYAWLRAIAAEFVRDHAHQIHAVAEGLLDRTVLTGAEVKALMQQARWGQKGTR